MARSRKGSKGSKRSRRSRRSSRRRMYKGGNGGGAAENMLRVVGTSDQQFDNVMNGASNSNVILPLQSSTTLVNSAPVNSAHVGGQKGGTTSPTGVPSNNGMMSNGMMGNGMMGNGMMGNGMMGKDMMGNGMMGKGMKGGRHKKKGGFFGMGSVINQAVVPFGILAMQQSYGRKHHSGSNYKGTRRRFR